MKIIQVIKYDKKANEPLVVLLDDGTIWNYDTKELRWYQSSVQLPVKETENQIEYMLSLIYNELSTLRRNL